MPQVQKYFPDNVQIYLKNPHNGKETLIEIWAVPLGRYTVRAGASSDFSYTGTIGYEFKTIQDVEQAIREAHKNEKQKNAFKIFK